MKKFFALVLALVMALSLATVAWGADVTLAADTDATANNPVAISGSNCEYATALAAGETFNGAGKTYTVTGSDAAKEDVAIYLTGSAVIKNVTIDCAGRGIDTDVSAVTSVVIDNVTILNSERALHIQAPANLDVSNSTFAGKISYVLSGGTATFTNCTFKANSALTVKGNMVEPWSKTVFVNCVFEDGFEVSFDDWNNVNADSSKAMTLTNCTYDGDPLTAANMGDLFTNTTGVDVATVTTAAFTGVAYNVYDANGNLAVANTTYTVTDGAYNVKTATGSVEYFTIDKLAGKFVEVAKADADYYVTLVGQSGALMYLAEVPYVNYTSAKAYSNIGTACGQLPGNDAKYDYFTYSDADGVPYYFVETAVSATEALMVNGELVFVKTAGTTVPHTWEIKSVNAKHEVTELVCDDCDAVATVYATKLAAPKGAVYYAPYGWIAVNAPAVTPSTDKVQSAQTFDAGIAMYVGMSVMAAAGSVVVFKKRED